MIRACLPGVEHATRSVARKNLQPTVVITCNRGDADKRRAISTEILSIRPPPECVLAADMDATVALACSNEMEPAPHVESEAIFGRDCSWRRTEALLDAYGVFGTADELADIVSLVP